ncbi:MAG: DNA-binding protein [Burkholderiales bacterium]
MEPDTVNLQPLERETRSHLTTAEAARHLNRSMATLRWWSCYDCGPIRPVRVNGRLAWPVADIRRLLGVEK